MKKSIICMVLLGGCLALLAQAGCKQETKTHGYGTVVRAPEAGLNEGKYSRYFYSDRDYEQYYLRDVLGLDQSVEINSPDYYTLPIGLTDTEAGAAIAAAIQKDINRWQKKEPSFQGYDIIKKRYPVEERDVSVTANDSVNGILSMMYKKEYYYRDIDDRYHGYINLGTKNYDMNTGRELKLADLFYRETNYVNWLEDYFLKTGQLRMEDCPTGTTITEDAEFFLSSSGLMVFLDNQFEKDSEVFFLVSMSDMLDYSALESYRDDSEYAKKNMAYGDIARNLYDYVMSGMTLETERRPLAVDNERMIEKRYLWYCPFSSQIQQSVAEYNSDLGLYVNEDDYREFREICEEIGNLSFHVESRLLINLRGGIYSVRQNQRLVVDSEEDYGTELMALSAERRAKFYEVQSGVTGKRQYFDSDGNPITGWDIFRDSGEAQDLLAGLCINEQEKKTGTSYSKEEWKELLKSAEVAALYNCLQISVESNRYSISWNELIPYLK